MNNTSDEKWLIVCDIDGTLLLPALDNPGLEQFNLFVEKNRNRIILALNSGRSLDEVAMVAEFGPIARPDWLICGVGTSLYSGFTPDTADAEWEDLMGHDWLREDIREALAACPGLTEQEAWNQHTAKLSYYFDDPPATVLPEIIRLTAKWKGQFKQIVCLDRYLDIMPLWGGKGAPVQYLAGKLGVPRSRVIVSGDSGNDHDMLDRGYPSILVVNHAPDLNDLVGAKDIFASKKPAASGVLEGMAFFGLS